MNSAPRILCIGGHDPTGGAGIQADIETVHALGGVPSTLITALTVQDTCDVTAAAPVDAAFLERAGATLIDDIRPDLIKIGLIGSAQQIPVLLSLVRRSQAPVVLDPVLAAGGGFDLSGQDLIAAIAQALLPAVKLVTPNLAEARRLTGADKPEDAAHALLETGADAVLLTATDGTRGEQVINRLYRLGAATLDYPWPRLAGHFNGSGCTLASACATLLGRGRALEDAVQEAQAFTWKALAAADAVGRGQQIPRRLT
jgi:hydroxymethylpyrimidine/phosphomethylpyrimidine kinase